MRLHLSRRLTLEAPQPVPDGAGGISTVWQALGVHWAEIIPGTGRDIGGEEVKLSSVAYRISLRAAPVGSERRPQPGQRLTEAGRVYHILAVAERDAAGRYLTCFAREERVT